MVTCQGLTFVMVRTSSRSSPRSAAATMSSQAIETKPDVAVLDIEMPGIDGITAAAANLDIEMPSCRVLIVTTFGRAGYLRRAMEAGALGFIVKDVPAEQLANAIRRVHRGERVVDAALAAATLAYGPSQLTARETDVLNAAHTGHSISDIASELFPSEGTVRNYVSSAITKLGVRNRTEAIHAALERAGCNWRQEEAAHALG
jgi:two-component system, NarL family, response regulator DesR